MTDVPHPAESPRAPIRLKLFGRTDVGRIREHNEDNFLIADLTTKSRGMREEEREPLVQANGNMFGVCDGMGGAAAGEVASQMAVDLIYERMAAAERPLNRDELARTLVTAIEEAGLKIYNAARSDSSRRGMGTTSTVAVMMDERVFLGQVGDSRGYILRGDQFVQVTRDQSLVNQLIEAGQLTEEEAETFEHNNIILQALGTSETVQVDLTYVDVRDGDTLLLCSDGLSGMIRDGEIKEVLQRTSNPMEACQELTERANQAGGHDNITVLVIQFGGEGLKKPSADDPPLAYRKYELRDNDTRTDGVVTRTAPMGKVETGAPSEEAAREQRELRVSHTMIGTLNPAAHAMAASKPYERDEDPVDLPTHSTTPWIVGAIVTVSLLLVLAVVLFLLR